VPRQVVDGWLSVKETPIDAVSACGFKWLCGPYATGLCWLGAELRERLHYPLPNWLRLQEKGGLNYELPAEETADAYDVFCTANFLDYMPWTAAVEQLLSLGIDTIAAHDHALVERLVSGLPQDYRLLSPQGGPAHSTLVFASHAQRERNSDVLAKLVAAGIDIALREDDLRFAPHLYNSTDDIDRTLDVLAEAGRPTRRSSRLAP
jgi:cysteine desulfurase/selenocysteine lyase